MPTPRNNRRDFLSVSVSAAVATGMAQGGFFSSADGSEKKKPDDKLKNKKGKVEFFINSYIINKGIADSIFK